MVLRPGTHIPEFEHFSLLIVFCPRNNEQSLLNVKSEQSYEDDGRGGDFRIWFGCIFERMVQGDAFLPSNTKKSLAASVCKHGFAIPLLLKKPRKNIFCIDELECRHLNPVPQALTCQNTMEKRVQYIIKDTITTRC